MDKADVEAAAALLADARRGHSQIDSLPPRSRPQSVADAHAIQDAVAARLGLAIGAYKGSAPALPGTARAAAPGSEGVRAPIFAPTVHASPCLFPTPDAPQCGIEAEVAFRFTRDLPPRPAPYSPDEIAAAVDCHAAIEVVTSRLASPDAGYLDKLADCISNGGFVYGSSRADWRSLRFAELPVSLVVNGTTIVDQAGGHPTGDPFAVVVAIVEVLRPTVGLKAGQFVTCGSYTGLRYFRPGDVCEIAFAGLGGARVTFSP